MTATALARSSEVANALRTGGYEVAETDLAGQATLLAESPYALVAYCELSSWDRIEERVFDIQAALTRFAAEKPSALLWDLYLVVHLLVPASPATDALVEAVEADTSYARKLVRVQIDRGRLDSALRPLLPLRPELHYALGEPLEQIRQELSELRVDDALADAALEAFKHDGKVRIP